MRHVWVALAANRSTPRIAHMSGKKPRASNEPRMRERIGARPKPPDSRRHCTLSIWVGRARSTAVRTRRKNAPDRDAFAPSGASEEP